jgi:hypothetical protein
VCVERRVMMRHEAELVSFCSTLSGVLCKDMSVIQMQCQFVDDLGYTFRIANGHR